MNPPSKPPFIDELARRLRAHGVSRRYVRRLAGELGDHFRSLVEQHERRGLGGADARRLAERQLGDPDVLLAEVVSRQKVGRFVRGHPFVVFALAPVPLTLILVLAFALLGTGSYLLFVRLLDVSSVNRVLVFVYHWGFYGFAYALTPLLALAYCRLAARYRCPLWMPLASCVMLCAAGGIVKVDFVQCTLSGSTKYFQRWGLDAVRLWLPLAVFAAHAAARLLREHLGRPALPK